MKYLWRRLTDRCIHCGQKISSERTTKERLAQINYRADRMAASLGRWPQSQPCKHCQKIVLEGQSGFVQRFLLIDM
jgi:hypothetical protein